MGRESNLQAIIEESHVYLSEARRLEVDNGADQRLQSILVPRLLLGKRSCGNRTEISVSGLARHVVL